MAEENPVKAVPDVQQDVEDRSLEKAVEAAKGVSDRLSEKLRAVVEMPGVDRLMEQTRMVTENSAMTRFSEQMRVLEENSSWKRMAEATCAFEEHSSAKRMTEAMRLFEDNSSLKRISETIRALDENSGLRRAAEAMRGFGENSSIKRILESLGSSGELARAALGPTWELRNAGVFDAVLSSQREMESVTRAMQGFEARFRMPEMNEAARLAAEFYRQDSFAAIFKRYLEHEDAVRQAIERMNKPWVDIQDTMRSVTGFAEMQGIGHALRELPGFDETLSSALRLDLGDWRDTITFPPEIFTDFTARSGFYLDRGFNPALTDFPPPAFEKSLDLAGLREEPPPLMERYGPPIPASEDADEEEGLVRTNIAHNWLQRLERLVRRFIDAEMTRAFGPDWVKRRLPNGLYDSWCEKKQAAEDNGAVVLPLIAYADFTDYVLIICKRDNWREVFEASFGRVEDVRESFQRLYPIRLDMAHARLITQDDELLLYVEAKRLVKVMRKRGN